MKWKKNEEESAEEQNEEAEQVEDQESMTPEEELGKGQTDMSEEGEKVIEEDVTKPEEEGRERSKAARFFRKVLIWLVIVAVAFGAGVGTTYYVLYQPAMKEAAQTTQALEDAEAEVANLEGEVERLSAFEERNQELEAEIKQTKVHITLLSARSSVSDALLALSEDNLAEAKLELDKVGKTLVTLESMLNEDQVEVVINMQQRHELIMEELEEDRFSARSDLEVLSSKLGSLENTLFASP